MKGLVTLVYSALVVSMVVLFPMVDRANARPVVVELFTSQGCSSCPPADRNITSLADQEGVLALSFHVDYWNRLGWTDPFSSKDNTARQRSYITAMRERSLYTPHVVVDGKKSVSGFSLSGIQGAVDQAHRYAEDVPISVKALDHTTLQVEVKGSDFPKSSGTVFYELYLVAYDSEQKTDVRSGENTGRMLKNSNVVKDYVLLGQGAAQDMKVQVHMQKIQHTEHLAFILQERHKRHIVGAVTQPFPL